jgi:hypothetical protein
MRCAPSHARVAVPTRSIAWLVACLAAVNCRDAESIDAPDAGATRDASVVEVLGPKSAGAPQRLVSDSVAPVGGEHVLFLASPVDDELNIVDLPDPASHAAVAPRALNLPTGRLVALALVPTNVNQPDLALAVIERNLARTAVLVSRDGVVSERDLEATPNTISNFSCDHDVCHAIAYSTELGATRATALSIDLKTLDNSSLSTSALTNVDQIHRVYAARATRSLIATARGLVVVGENGPAAPLAETVSWAPERTRILVTADPYEARALVAATFDPPSRTVRLASEDAAGSLVVGNSCQLSESSSAPDDAGQDEDGGGGASAGLHRPQAPNQLPPLQAMDLMRDASSKEPRILALAGGHLYLLDPTCRPLFDAAIDLDLSQTARLVVSDAYFAVITARAAFMGTACDGCAAHAIRSVQFDRDVELDAVRFMPAHHAWFVPYAATEGCSIVGAEREDPSSATLVLSGVRCGMSFDSDKWVMSIPARDERTAGVLVRASKGGLRDVFALGRSTVWASGIARRRPIAFVALTSGDVQFVDVDLWMAAGSSSIDIAARAHQVYPK